MLRLYPLAAGAVGFLHKATGSEVEPVSIRHPWTFKQNLQDGCNSISAVTCQGAEGQIQPMAAQII